MSSHNDYKSTSYKFLVIHEIIMLVIPAKAGIHAKKFAL